MTSNAPEVDMWDPNHAFGNPHSQMDSDEDESPTTGLRPRDLITGRRLTVDEVKASKRKRTAESDEDLRKHRRHH